jgi:hypothetical protein
MMDGILLGGSDQSRRALVAGCAWQSMITFANLAYLLNMNKTMEEPVSLVEFITLLSSVASRTNLLIRCMLALAMHITCITNNKKIIS